MEAARVVPSPIQGHRQCMAAPMMACTQLVSPHMAHRAVAASITAPAAFTAFGSQVQMQQPAQPSAHAVHRVIKQVEAAPQPQPQSRGPRRSTPRYEPAPAPVAKVPLHHHTGATLVCPPTSNPGGARTTPQRTAARGLAQAPASTVPVAVEVVYQHFHRPRPALQPTVGAAALGPDPDGSEGVRLLLEEVLREVRHMSSRQAIACADIDRTLRQPLAELNGDNRKHKDPRLNEMEQQLQDALEELKERTGELAQAKAECGRAVACKLRLEAVLKSRDYSAEHFSRLVRQRCLELEQSEQDPHGQYRALSSIMNSFEAAAAPATAPGTAVIVQGLNHSCTRGPDDEEPTLPTREDQSGRVSLASEATLREGDAKRVLEAELDRAREQQEESLELRRRTIARCQELERSEQEMRDRLQELSERLRHSEAQAEEGERRALERISHVEAEKGALQAEVERMRAQLEQQRRAECERRELHSSTAAACRELEGSQRDLQAELAKLKRSESSPNLQRKVVELQERLRSAEAEHDRAQLQLRRAEQEARQWQERFIQAEKDGVALQKTVGEHKKVMWELENQLRQERNVANVCAPGEFLRLVKVHEGSNLAVENGRLKKELLAAQCDLTSCRVRLGEHNEQLPRACQGGNPTSGGAAS